MKNFNDQITRDPDRQIRGFTLIELMVVLSIIIILASMGLAQYRNSIVRANEAVLKEDLFRMRDAIDQYYADKGQYPTGLDVARQRRLPAEDARRSVHEIRQFVAGGPRRTRSQQSQRQRRRVRREERIGWHGARRLEIRGLVNEPESTSRHILRG